MSSADVWLSLVSYSKKKWQNPNWNYHARIPFVNCYPFPKKEEKKKTVLRLFFQGSEEKHVREERVWSSPETGTIQLHAIISDDI